MEVAGGAFPFALDNGQVAAAQLDADVRYTLTAPTLGARGETVVAKELGQEDVGSFFADAFGVGGTWGGARVCAESYFRGTGRPGLREVT